jgi:aspartokinase
MLRRYANDEPLIKIIDEISSKTKDIIVGAGEKLSCRIMAGLLRDRVSSLGIELT